MTDEDQLLLKDLKAKVQELFDGYKILEQKNKLLQEDVLNLENKVKELEQDKIDIGQKNEQLKIANRLLSKQDENQEAKQKINFLVREIDKCIALLNK